MEQEPDVTAPVEEEELDERAFESDLLTNHQEKQHRHKWNSIDDKVGEPEEGDDQNIYRAANAVGSTIVRGAGAIDGAIEWGICSKLDPWLETVEEEVEHHISVASCTHEFSCSNFYDNFFHL